MKVEQRIYGGVPDVRRQRSDGETRKNPPLGVHFGPRIQFGPALDGHMPVKSLPIEVSTTQISDKTERPQTLRQAGGRHRGSH